jgi:hypothetical protein
MSLLDQGVVDIAHTETSPPEDLFYTLGALIFFMYDKWDL